MEDSSDEQDQQRPSTDTVNVNRSNTTRINSAAWALTQAQAGERIDFRVPRGLLLKRHKADQAHPDPEIVETSWLQMVQSVLQYEFRDPLLLEEALECDGSGVSSVGQGPKTRTFDHGNRSLARVGDQVLRLVQADVAYRARIAEDDAAHKIKKLLTESSLVRVGQDIALHIVVRPPMPPSEKQRKKFMSKSSHKIDINKLLVDALLAVIAAVYMDSGFDAVKQVISHLGLFISNTD